MKNTAKQAPAQDTVTDDLGALGLRTWLSVVRAYNECDVVLATKLEALGFTTAQYEVLTRLQRDPGLTQQALAQRCFVAKSGMSMLLKRMEDDGWVQRRADRLDARAKRLTLTELGQRQAKRMVVVQNQVVTAMAAPLTKIELVRLSEMMGRVSASLKAI